MEILNLIDKLEALATQSKKVPLTGKRMLGAERLLELVDQMRLAVPRGVQEAEDMLGRREQVINQALSDAKRIRAAAEIESRTRLEESEMVRSAKRRGDEILQEAEAQGRQLMERVHVELKVRRAGADDYAREALTSLEQDVEAVLKSIRHGLDAVAPKNQALAAVNGEKPAKA
jgi:hypothetical protein